MIAFKKIVPVATVSAIFASSFALCSVASASTLAAPAVTVSGQGAVSPSNSTGSTCLAKYGLTNSDGATFTFSNYQRGTEIRLRLYDSGGNQVLHVIDYVESDASLGIASQCNNLVVASSEGWLPVTVPAGLDQINLIGISSTFSDSGSGVGYFQSQYVSGSISSAVTVTPIVFPVSTVPQSTTATTTVSPTTSRGSKGTSAITESPDLTALEPWSTNTITNLVNCFSSQTPGATQVTNFEFGTGSQTLEQKEIAFRIQSSHGQALQSAVLYLGGSTCKKIYANTSGFLKNWFQVNLPLTPGGSTSEAIWLLLPTTSNISNDQLTVAYANGISLGPPASMAIPQLNDLIVHGAGFWTCALLGTIGTVGMASRIGVQVIATAVPDVPALADIENVTDIVVNAQVNGADSAVPTSDGQVDADFKTLKDAEIGIQELKAKGISATIKDASKDEIEFQTPDVGSALNIASELSSDSQEAKTMVNLAGSVGCHL